MPPSTTGPLTSRAVGRETAGGQTIAARDADAGPVARSSPVLPVAVALVLVGLVLRPQILAIGPLLPAIRADLDIPFAVGGLLATIPVLCMGLFAPVGPWLVRRTGPRVAIAACVAAIAVFGLARAGAPGIPLILLLTFAIGVGTGTIGPALAMVVSVRAPNHPALATGAYASGIMLGSTIAAGVAVPLAGASGDWRFALLVLSAAALVPLGAWLVLVAPDRGTPHGASAPRSPLPWRSVTAWAISLVFGLQSIVYYGVISWLPNTFVEHGWTAGAAGSLVATLNGVGLISTVGVPLFADRVGTRRGQLLVAATATVVGLLGVVLAPGLGLGWVALLGLSLGAVFPLVLTLPVDVADRPADIGAAAALMLLVGYALSSLSPVVLGVMRDATGDFAASMWLLVVLAAALVAAVWTLSPARLRGGVGHR